MNGPYAVGKIEEFRDVDASVLPAEVRYDLVHQPSWNGNPVQLSRLRRIAASPVPTAERSFEYKFLRALEDGAE